MFETMHEYQGVGLAAPQVHESLRVFVAGFAPPRRRRGRVAARRAAHGAHQSGDHADRQEIVDDWEGCLSIPDIRGRVPRARQISVRAYDRRGKRIEIKAGGFTARVIQHETDHLDGVLFFDRMRSFETLTFLDEFGRYWSGDATGELIRSDVDHEPSRCADSRASSRWSVFRSSARSGARAARAPRPNDR